MNENILSHLFQGNYFKAVSVKKVHSGSFLRYLSLSLYLLGIFFWKYSDKHPSYLYPESLPHWVNSRTTFSRLFLRTVPWYQRFFFLVGGEAAKTSREALLAKHYSRSTTREALLALTNVSRRWRARRPLASRVLELHCATLIRTCESLARAHSIYFKLSSTAK